MKRIFLVLIALAITSFASGASANLNGKGAVGTKCHAKTTEKKNWIYVGTYRKSGHLICVPNYDSNSIPPIDCEHPNNLCEDGWANS